ncbi:LysR family transcriptional regulator [Lampropedia puyangensis]|uniref:LysR family transcriptional regulator n=2 Tax=Lampropedia puyangensis TaxID=1330072 RepID=A0A4S8F1N3_9BURK|nr:LysR family transcriptional regulator [Lampropedia puyangensis]
MEMRQLRYFVGVAEAGSLLAASERLHIAQPALGQQISALEEDVQAKLFERSRRGMQLTEAGKVFLEHAHLILADAERARLAVRDMASIPRGQVALGLPTTVALIASIPLLQACREQLPQVQLNIVEAYSGFLREWLQAGRLDVAVLMGDAADASLTQTPMLMDELVFVAGPQGKKLPRQLPMQALAQWPMIVPSKGHGLRKIIDQANQGHTHAWNVVAEMDSLGSVKRAVQAGLGCTILPAGAVAQEVQQGLLRTAHIDSALMNRRVVCAVHAARPMSAAGTAVHGLVQQVLRRMVAQGSWPAQWIGDDRPA